MPLSKAKADPVLILSGPPGVGKSTAARMLAERSTSAVNLEADAFFRFIGSGYVEPWRRESHEQNRVVMEIVGRAATGYAAAGYFTIVEGIVIPGWFFEPLRDALQAAGHAVAFAALRAPLSVCMERARGRERAPLAESSVVEQLWQSFADLGELERHVIDTDGASPEAVCEQLSQRLAGGLLAVE